MTNRREFLATGLAAIASGSIARQLHAATAAGLRCSAHGPGLPIGRTRPILPVELSRSPHLIGELLFAPRWFGDSFPKNNLPFHQCEDCTPWPDADEVVDVAVIGGGLSGLAAAHRLRERKPVVFELRSRFGGNCMGESFGGQSWSMGSAYFMVPDRGDRLDHLYRELGVYDEARVDRGSFAFEWAGEISDNPCLAGCSPLELAAVESYRSLISFFANDAYPDIPLPEREADWIRELDRATLQSVIDSKCGPHLPSILRESIQAYCYSSFGVGSEELSAAAGFNFLAAEEYGRLVLPGGNAGLVERLWSHVRSSDSGSDEAGGSMLRAGCLVEGVRLLPGGKVLVRWRTPDGTRRALLARHAVITAPKFVAQRLIDQLDRVDPGRIDALEAVTTVPYLVANVILRRPAKLERYDLFLLHDHHFPMVGDECGTHRPIVDVVDGSFARPARAIDALTLYWPLPWDGSRFTIVGEQDWQTYAEIAASQIRTVLELVGLLPADVAEVRLTRWGHAMPVARPGQIADGVAERIRQPIEDRIWFVQQDNWLLPAVETCLEEAMTFGDQIDAML